jgi:hypothetical protein
MKKRVRYRDIAKACYDEAAEQIKDGVFEDDTEALGYASANAYDFARKSGLGEDDAEDAFYFVKRYYRIVNGFVPKPDPEYLAAVYFDLYLLDGYHYDFDEEKERLAYAYFAAEAADEAAFYQVNVTETIDAYFELVKVYREKGGNV